MSPGPTYLKSIPWNVLGACVGLGGVLLLLPLILARPLEAISVVGVAAAALPLIFKCLGRAAPAQPFRLGDTRKSSAREAPFVSIHVATHDEPPAVVIRTLESLAAMGYPAERHEIVVLDNNTPDSATWLPVAEWCGRAPARFHFHHLDGVAGAKAGALNEALALTAAGAEMIATVDSDYEVGPAFLRTAVLAFEDPRLSHVQFPQAYRGAGEHGAAVEAELRQYFDAYARSASRSGTMLLTGTLSVIRRDALERGGGWPTATITEDAHLGARLLEGGGKGVFIDRNAGRGLLPTDLASFSQQRHRWASGNAQTLRESLLSSPRSLTLPVLAQLCAWLSAAGFLLPAGLLALALPGTTVPAKILLAGFLGLVVAETGVAYLSSSGSAGTRLRAAMVRFGMLPEGHAGLACGLGFRRLCFQRTPKDRRRPDKNRGLRGISALLFVVAAGAVAPASPLAAASLAVPALILLVRGWIAGTLSRTETLRTVRLPEAAVAIENLATQTT